MTHSPKLPELTGTQVLVLEDDFYLASDLSDTLTQAGATVVGPFPDAESACEAVRSARPDCALVDVNLGEGATFELPRALDAQHIPFLFVTGYDRAALPPEFENRDRLLKPIVSKQVISAVARLVENR